MKNSGKPQSRKASPRSGVEMILKEDEKYHTVEELEKMPRYKFSVIYYPDSKVWTIKNDFSGDSTKMTACDGQLMETFIKTQLPEEEQETLVVRTKPEVSILKETTSIPQQRIPGKMEGTLVLRTQTGETIQGFAKTGSIATVEFIPSGGGNTDGGTFEAKVMAKSLENNTTYVIGAVHRQNLVNGRLEVPVYGGNNLKKGMYRLMADFNRIEQEIPVPAYQENRLVMLD